MTYCWRCSSLSSGQDRVCLLYPKCFPLSLFYSLEVSQFGIVLCSFSPIYLFNHLFMLVGTCAYIYIYIYVYILGRVVIQYHVVYCFLCVFFGLLSL